jgi:DNA ligase-1
MLLEEIARTSTDVAGTRSRLAKVDRLATCLARLATDEVPPAVAYLSGALPQGTIGVGWASLRDLPPPATSASLQLLEVHTALERIRVATGKGSQAARRRELTNLFARATDPERRFLFGLLLGELRQGALAGVMVDAVARAAGVPPSEVRRALMVAGDLGVVARAALTEGPAGLAPFRLALLRPVQPMLAQTAEDLSDALARVSPAAVEWKLDGARIQVHRLGDDVRVFTRNLADITARVPEIVESVRRLRAETLVLDGEAIAFGDAGRPLAFQDTMSRFGSSLEVAQRRRATQLTAAFFDCLHLDGDDLLDRPAAERFAALAAVLPEELRVRRLETDDAVEAERFLAEALASGHEGVMVKALDAPYEAGRRGGSWLKVKRAHTLDLAVLAAEWGHGRRRGRLSNLHLGARDPATGGFVMLGKTFKGMTDAMLAWQTERLLELETHRDSYTVYVRPELVVEIAFDGVQASSRYPGGLALRFARVKRYRQDKGSDDTDTIDTVRNIHGGVFKLT